MFLLRCAFWLTIVYCALLWRGNYIGGPASLVGATRETAQAALDRATFDVTQACGERPAECLDAAGLTSLVRTMAQDRAGSASSTPEATNDAAARRHVSRPVTH